MAEIKITQLPEKVNVIDDDWIEIVDTEDLTESPEGSSKKAKKVNILSTPTLDEVCTQGNFTNSNIGIGTASPTAELEVVGNIKLTETEATIDTDKFVVLDNGVLKYRTGAQVLSDTGISDLSQHISFGESYASNYRSIVLDAGGTFFPRDIGYEIGLMKQQQLFTKSQLLLLPSGISGKAVHNLKPKNSTFYFTRGSVATYVDEDGLIKEALTDVPRINYDIIDSEVSDTPALLLEPQRTNNILNSQSLSNASWMKFNSGLGTAPITTDNYAISPSGEMNASRLQMSLGGGTTSSDRAFIRQSLTSQTDYYFSVYLKSTNGAEQKLNWHYGSDDFLITVTDEWQRFELNRNSSSTLWSGLGLRGNLVSALGIDDSVDILVYGFQVEQGVHPTSYIPTYGSTVTRNADLCNNSGIGNVLNDSEGVLYAQIGVEVDDGFISLNDGTTSNRASIYLNRTNQTIRVICSSGGFGQVDTTYTSPISISENVKVALKYKENDFALWVNGSEVRTDNSGLTPVGLSQCDFAVNTILPFYGKCKDLRYYNIALTDTELQQLTTL